MGPMSPDEIGEHRKQVIPAVVFTVVNGLIANDISHGFVRLTRGVVVSGLEAAGVDVSSVNLVTVMETYGNVGWDVRFDRPGYSESYEPFWEFRKK